MLKSLPYTLAMAHKITPIKDDLTKRWWYTPKLAKLYRKAGLHIKPLWKGGA